MIKRFILRNVASIYKLFKTVYFSVEYQSYRQKYKLAADFRFNGENIIFYGDGEIEIAENSYIGWNSSIQSASGCLVKIGRNCSISHNVRIYTESKTTSQNFDVKKKNKKSGNVDIGNGVWIGVNVIINPGVSIGNNVVIGANSVVTRNIEGNTVVGGVPARFIKKITFDD